MDQQREDEPIYDINYSYDDKGRLKKVDRLHKDGSIHTRWMFEYSTDKNYKISEYVPLDGGLEYEYYYVNGLLIRSKAHNINSDCTYSYNPQRRLIKKDYGGGNLRTYAYNQKGWDSHFNYETDTKGNWILQREKGQPGEVYVLTERKITYK